MMRRFVLSVAALLGLAACNTPIADTIARDAARSTVTPILQARFPGVPLEPATNCVIDNASAGEIITLATAASTGANDTAARTVFDVLRRPDTIQCIAADGLPVLLNGL
jgi:hypothetical protein